MSATLLRVRMLPPALLPVFCGDSCGDDLHVKLLWFLPAHQADYNLPEGFGRDEPKPQACLAYPVESPRRTCLRQVIFQEEAWGTGDRFPTYRLENHTDSRMFYGQVCADFSVLNEKEFLCEARRYLGNLAGSTASGTIQILRLPTSLRQKF